MRSAESIEQHLEELRETLESAGLVFPTSVYSGPMDARAAMEATRRQEQPLELASKVCL